jgi:hypothetical protein
MRAGRFFRTPWRVGILVLALVGCASTPPQEQVSEFQNKAMQARVDKLNMQLALQSAAAGVAETVCRNSISRIWVCKWALLHKSSLEVGSL